MVILESDLTTIVLRSPELGDRYNYNTQVKIKRSMDNTLYTYKKTPTLVIREMKFKYISTERAIELMGFIQATEGTQIRMRTQYPTGVPNELWIGKITNSLELIAAGLENTEFTLVFEGFQYANS